MVDTHCHLDKNSVINALNNMDGIIVISGNDDKTNREVIELVNKYERIYGTIGIHPTEYDDFNDESLKFIEDNLNNPKIVGIGEIGLDYHWGKDKSDIQKEWFIKQISLADKYNLPIVIHSRDAYIDTYNILKDYKQIKKLMHCYSYSLECAYELMKINVKFGIGGVVTFKNADKLKNVVEKIDLSNLVLETDSPYLSPEPFRGKVNEPKNVYYVAKKIAEIKNITLEEVIDNTTKNAYQFFELEGK